MHQKEGKFNSKETRRVDLEEECSSVLCKIHALQTSFKIPGQKKKKGQRRTQSPQKGVLNNSEAYVAFHSFQHSHTSRYVPEIWTMPAAYHHVLGIQNWAKGRWELLLHFKKEVEQSRALIAATAETGMCPLAANKANNTGPRKRRL